MTSSGPDTSTRTSPRTTGTDRTHREARDRAAARTVARRSAARYEPHLDGLFTYCLSVLCDHEAATAALADALHLAERRDRYVPDELGSLRAWLYALARWACLRTLAEARQKRQASHAGGRSGRQRASAGHQDAPAVAPEEQERRRRELAALAWPEAAGTSPEQREALELAVRHRLAAHEVAAVLGMAPAAARELLATAACEVERTRAALAVVETGACPGVAHLTGEQGMVLGTTLRRELVRHVDDCPRCRRTAERAVPGRWPGTSVTPDTLPLVPAPAATLHTALAHHPRARGGAPRFDRRGFPMNPKDRVARRDRLRARAVTTTVVATVVAAPVLALWAAYRGTPVGEGVGGGPSTAREDGTVDFDGGEGGAGYENAGNARPRPGTRFGADGAPDVSVEVVEVAGAGHKGAAALGVTAAHSGDTTLITLTARGDAPVRWSASTGASWLYLNRSSGTLAPGESVTIRVFVDQLREPSGHWRATVAISPAGSVVSIEGYGPAPAGPVTGSPSAPGTPSGPPPSPSHPDPTPTTPTPTDPTPTDPPSSSDPDPSTPTDPTPTDPSPSDPSPSDPSGPSDPAPSDPSGSTPPGGTDTPDPGTS
ncbi:MULTISPECIES: BACON domain-containing protein [Streptomyces]|uniref:BACON domain-containing protein n=1 Tax=Streptomyces TaxID=1883 RepID=UPI0004C66325|nr:sigma-70 family RNA polymerase sigma factor [Streptomyces sp. NRRL F-5527]